MANERGYLDISSETRAHRRRIIVQRAASTSLSGLGAAPAFGGTATTGWVQLPGDAIELADGGSVKFPNEPHAESAAEAGVWKMRVNYTAMHYAPDGTESTDVQEVAEWLYDYRQVNEGSTGVTGSTRTFDLQTRIMIQTDDGDASLSIGNFRTEFDGVIRVLPEKVADVVPGESFVQDIEVWHIARAVMETVKMSWVCERVLQFADPYENSIGRTHFSWAIEWAYKSSTGGEIWGWLHRYALENTNSRSVFYAWREIFTAIEIVCEEVYQAFARSDSATFRMRQGGAATGTIATPFDHITLYKKIHAGAPDADGRISMPKGDALSMADLHFLGAVQLETGPFDGDYVGGLLIAGEGEETLNDNTYDVWSYLSDMADYGLKMKPILAGDGDLRWYIGRIFDTYNTATDLTLADLAWDNPDDGSPIGAIVEGAGVIANAKVAVAESAGADVPEVAVSGFGSRSDQGADAQLLWDNHPLIDQQAAWNAVIGTGNGTPGTTVASINYTYCAYSFRAWVWKLYYFDDPTDLSASYEVPITVHPNVSLHNGFANLTVTLTPRLPTAGYDSGAQAQEQLLAPGGFAHQMRLYLHFAQRRALAYTLATSILDWFGDAKITRYDLKLEPGTCTLDHIGDEFRITTTGGSNPYTAQPLIDDDRVDRTDLYGRCWASAIAIDPDTGIIDITLIGYRFA